jgi:hypothetical protein
LNPELRSARHKSDGSKCGFLKKSFMINVGRCYTYPNVMTGNGQLTRGAFIKNDFLRNPHFKLNFYDQIDYNSF